MRTVGRRGLEKFNFTHLYIFWLDLVVPLHLLQVFPWERQHYTVQLVLGYFLARLFLMHTNHRICTRPPYPCDIGIIRIFLALDQGFYVFQYELIIWSGVVEDWGLSENMLEEGKGPVDFTCPSKWLGLLCTLLKRIGNVCESYDIVVII